MAIAAMILAIAYNPHFALMVTFGLCLLTSLALGTGIGHFLVLMGGMDCAVVVVQRVITCGPTLIRALAIERNGTLLPYLLRM